MTHIELFELALEALENLYLTCDWNTDDGFEASQKASKTIDYLRQAIATEESSATQEHIKILKEKTEDHDVDCLCADCEAIDNFEDQFYSDGYITTPVEIGVDVTAEGTTVVGFYRRPNSVMEMFYSQFHPQPKAEQEPKREWVGLTDEEIDTWNIVGHESLREFVRAIEAKLKEKNT